MEQLKLSFDIKSMYERLVARFRKHPGNIDQYSDLRKMLIKSGFKVSVFFRGKDYASNDLAGRYEILIEIPGRSYSKAGKGDSLGEAVKEAVEDCKQCYEHYQRSAEAAFS